MPSAMKLNVRRNNAGDTAPHRIDRCNHSSTPAHRSGLGALQAHHLTHGRTFQRAGRRVDGGGVTWRRKEVDNRRERAP